MKINVSQYVQVFKIHSGFQYYVLWFISRLIGYNIQKINKSV